MRNVNIEIWLPISIDLFDYLFFKSEETQKRFHEKQRNKNLEIGDWETVHNQGEKYRRYSSWESKVNLPFALQQLTGTSESPIVHLEEFLWWEYSNITNQRKLRCNSTLTFTGIMFSDRILVVHEWNVFSNNENGGVDVMVNARVTSDGPWGMQSFIESTVESQVQNSWTQWHQIAEEISNEWIQENGKDNLSFDEASSYNSVFSSTSDSFYDLSSQDSSASFDLNRGDQYSSNEPRVGLLDKMIRESQELRMLRDQVQEIKSESNSTWERLHKLGQSVSAISTDQVARQYLITAADIEHKQKQDQASISRLEQQLKRRLDLLEGIATDEDGIWWQGFFMGVGIPSLVGSSLFMVTLGWWWKKSRT